MSAIYALASFGITHCIVLVVLFDIIVSVIAE